MATITHDQHGIMHVQYREDKRPLKVAVLFVDSYEREARLNTVREFIEAEANAPAHLARMEPVKFWAMIERLSTLFCRTYAPTANWNVTKPEIRGAVYFVVCAAIKAGDWPEAYVTNERTFVQFGGECDV